MQTLPSLFIIYNIALAHAHSQIGGREPQGKQEILHIKSRTHTLTAALFVFESSLCLWLSRMPRGSRNTDTHKRDYSQFTLRIGVILEWVTSWGDHQ